MSRRILLGPDTPIDLPKLIDSRLLIQANSGGGKSYAIRRLLEQTHGHVQQLVIDLEGEFATLRERYDYVLGAKQGGEAIVDPRAAQLLAVRLLELGASAILDIYELKHDARISFVRLFLEALINAPKNLWHPVLVVVDEAHVFCPEKGDAESAAAVIDLATRGRKRGYCAVLATQRISKLRKDAAAECNNVLIGRTGLDIDMKRAADVLGFKQDRQVELRRLEPGHFFGFGPALSPEVRDIAIGPVVTTHPKAGSRIAFTPPPPTAKIKALLPQLADLPAEAEHAARTLEEAKKENAVLKREIAQIKKGLPPAPTVQTPAKTVEKRVEIPVLKDGQFARFEKVMGGLPDRLAAAVAPAMDLPTRITAAVDPVVKAIREISVALAKLNGNGRALTPAYLPAPAHRPMPASRPVASTPRPLPNLRVENRKSEATDGKIGQGLPRRLLAALAQFGELRQKRLAMLAGCTLGGSTWRGGMAKLRSAAWIAESGDIVQLTNAGAAVIGTDYEPLPTGRDLVEYWRGKLRGGAPLRAFDAIVEAYPEVLTPEELAIAMKAEKGGSTMRGALAKLRGFELIGPGNTLRASDELFG